MSKTTSFITYLLLSIVVMTSWSCTTLNGLENEERALVKNRIELNTDIKSKRSAALKANLEKLYKQKPTKVSWFNPRTWGAVATVYDDEQSSKTAADLQQLLRNRKGFYDAEVKHMTRINGKEVEVIYIVNTGNGYYIDSLSYSSDDDLLLSVVNENSPEPLLKVGLPLDAQIFDAEKDRIVSLLQNKGYADFTKNFIEYQGDSLGNGATRINVHIYPPQQDLAHQQYKVGKVNIYTEHINGEYDVKGITDTLNGVSYIARNDEFVVLPQGISNAVRLVPGQLYEKQHETRTYQRLTALSPYRFAVINPIKGEESDSTINFDIFLTPRNKKWAFDAGSNLFYSTFSEGGRNNLLGFNTTFNLQNRNFLNRGYTHSIDLEGTFEFNFTDFPKIEPNTISFQIDNRVEIPKNIELFNLFGFLNRLNIIKDKVYKKFTEETITEFGLGYGYNDIINLYLLNSLNASWSYNYQPNERTRIRYTQLGLNYVNVNADSLFQVRFLDTNPLLAKSFTSQLFTGFLLRDISFYQRTRETKRRTQWAFIGNFEISGLENYLINSGVNLFRDNKDLWTLGDILFSKYIRLESDIRFYKKFGGKRLLATRFNVALAFPYGKPANEFDGQVPFVKQYFVGGPNSLRAWRLRELGPGGFSEFLLDPGSITNPFQAGNLKLDMSVEYRFKLFWLMDGALFVDAGNVWLLDTNEANPNGEISSDFFNQIAVGAGYGMRFDFDYFVLRLDFGYKVRNPFPDPETGSYSAFNRKYNPSIIGNVNFAINYPF